MINCEVCLQTYFKNGLCKLTTSSHFGIWDSSNISRNNEFTTCVCGLRSCSHCRRLKVASFKPFSSTTLYPVFLTIVIQIFLKPEVCIFRFGGFRGHSYMLLRPCFSLKVGQLLVTYCETIKSSACDVGC